jgi:hypothetical protein
MVGETIPDTSTISNETADESQEVVRHPVAVKKYLRRVAVDGALKSSEDSDGERSLYSKVVRIRRI